ncbi:MAG: hypothetical protein ACO3NK_09395, partial [Prochlorotrichaceae cyanobacterium]
LVFEDLTREKDRDERRDIAGIFCNFGNLLQQFPRGIRWLNLELSIRAYELALQVCTYQFFPQDWAALQMNLGIAYSDRIRGERAENLELAIVAYENALQIFTRDTFPEHWARSQLNLADAYRQRVQGDPEVNIEQAIKLYHQAAEVFTQTAYPHLWFANQSSLAAAYLTRATLHATDPEQLADINTAISLLREVLDTADPGAPTPDYIDAQYQLGNALKQRHALTQDFTDLQQALEAYTIALNAISPEHYDREKNVADAPGNQDNEPIFLSDSAGEILDVSPQEI